MSHTIFKNLYEVNQILKKNFSEYFYIHKLNSFYANNGNVIKLIKLKNPLMDTNFMIPNSGDLFTALKVVKVRDNIEFNPTNKNIEVILNSEKLPNLIDINSSSKRVDNPVNEFLKLKVLEVIDMETTCLINNGEDLGLNKKLVDFKSLLTQNRSFTNHLVFFLEIDTTQNEVKLHSKKTSINLDNPFLIFEGNYLVKLPVITKKKEPEEYFRIELLEKNHICLVYGNIDFETKIYFLTA